MGHAENIANLNSCWAKEGRTPRIAIVGAGLSGIGAVIALRQAGYTDLTVYEKADKIGGTWRDNRYPGLSNAWQHWFHQNGIDATKTGGTVFEQFALVTQAAIAGMGAALLPKFLIRPELESGELIPLIDTTLESNDGYYLVTPMHRANHAPVVALREWLKNECR